jgi:hypothetical protein
MKSKEEIRIEVAGIVFSIVTDGDSANVQIGEPYQKFLSSAQPEIFINAHYDGLPDIFLEDSNKIFDSGSTWGLYRFGERHAVVLGGSSQGISPYRIALFDFGSGKVDVYSKYLSDYIPSDPLEYPLAEILMVCLLAQERGLMIHACGIDDNGEGYLFAGNSTHGKTTIARIWKDYGSILNDDRIVLRYNGDGCFWMYGTPWHGDYNGVSSAGMPLKKIFFLSHANKNEINLVKGSEAVSMLLARCFPPLWDSHGMKFTLDFCSHLMDNIPCYTLNFVPDRNVIDFVRCVK